MLVGERMSKPVITITPDTPLQEALALMRKEKVRRFPVVDKHGKLVGIVSEKDLLNASPSDATTLSIWEVNYWLSKVTVEEIMTKEVITTCVDCPIEEAARIMADRKIGALPVMDDGRLVGIITETDLFKIFLELFGARKAGIRATLLVKDEPGKLSEVTNAIRQLGGNIIAVGTFMGEDPSTGMVTLKVENTTIDALTNALTPVVERIVDIRTVSAA
ncbi:MAG: CBS domain-containing protein [Anaerolineales bacterium]|nr:CBS domain-containing protein [Anaerolineales bacterium]